MAEASSVSSKFHHENSIFITDTDEISSKEEVKISRKVTGSEESHRINREEGRRISRSKKSGFFCLRYNFFAFLYSSRSFFILFQFINHLAGR